MIAKTNLSKKLLLGIGLIIGFNTIIFAHDASYLIKKDSTELKSMRRIHFGLEAGYGFSTFNGHKQAAGLHSRPYFSLIMTRRLSDKNEIMAKVFYRTLGNKFAKDVYEANSYNEIKFLGISANYLFAPSSLPLFIGVGISGERNIKYQYVTSTNGKKDHYTDDITFKKYNWSGEILLQYRAMKKILIEAKYSRGLVNIFTPLATEANGYKVYTEGLFLGVGILF